MAFIDDSDFDCYVTVEFRRETVEWLLQVSHDSGAPLEVLIASMVDTIRVDDQAAHRFH